MVIVIYFIYYFCLYFFIIYIYKNIRMHICRQEDLFKERQAHHKILHPVSTPNHLITAGRETTEKVQAYIT
jgi:hypothetical protein